MKSIKYILSVWAILSLSIFCFSCMDEEVPKNNQLWCDGKTLVLNLNAPATQIVSPMSKSAQTDTVMTDLNVLIYNEGGTLKEGHYYDSKNSAELIAALQKGQEKQLDIDLGENAKGTVYAIANYGSEINDGSGFGTESSIKEATFALNEDKQPKLYMYAEGGTFDVSSPDLNKVSMSLERIYSLVTVQIVKNLRQPTSGSFDVEPLSVQIKNIPTQGQFAANNLIGANNVGCLVDGEMLSRISEEDEKFLEVEHANAQAFYLYENRQPEGSSLNNNTDQTTKTPHGLPADEIISVIKQNRTCSYIEVKGKYIRNEQPEGVGSGEIIYRFFLGKDIYKDFDIERNTHYQVTLTLNGKGGADEATWRVETKLFGEIQVEDVYIGYRQGSKARMYVTGDVNLVNSDITVNKITDLTNVVGELFTVSNALQTDGEGRRYVEIEGNFTNAHDYAKRVGEVVFNLGENGIQKTKTAKVYQVPRLVDPIAIYKKAENYDPTNIIVREYNPGEKQYQPLVSKGKWTATVEKSSDGQWFKIRKIDKEGKPIGEQVGLGESITGEDEVRFEYKPDGPNGNTKEINSDRHGMILVKYHNNWCEHEIYVRQGYRPVVMNDTEGAAWSTFNCLGEDKDGQKPVAGSPTQTGWLFNGGVNKAMHPFSPGYRTPVSKILYSDGSEGKFNLYRTDIIAWEIPVDTVKNTSSSIGKQGPCPEGYIVPNAWTYREMTNATEVTTGYVYDDDFSENNKYTNPNGSVTYGWGWGSDGNAVVDESIHSNPAKGSLFVKTDGCTNLFFGYGKGVLTNIKDRDENLVAEIGVGHRASDGSLTYSDHNDDNKKTNHAYGGFYWNATNFLRYSVGAGEKHMGKVDFGYNVFRREPNLLDVPGSLASIGGVPAVGIDGNDNASFVRCVKADVKYMEIVLNTNLIFKYSGAPLKSSSGDKLTFYADAAMGKREIIGVVTFAGDDGKPDEAVTLKVPDYTIEVYCKYEYTIPMSASQKYKVQVNILKTDTEFELNDKTLWELY